MTLYLVKWADGSFALVTAEDERALVDTLDQLGDPGAASWQPFDGAVWLEFPNVGAALPMEGDVDPLQVKLGRPSVAETDHGGDFAEAVLAAVHPTLSALRAQALAQDRGIGRAELDAALRADLDFALPGSIYGRDEGPDH